MKLVLISFTLFSFYSQGHSVTPPFNPKKNSLHEAVYNRDIKKVEVLIKKGININERNGNKKMIKGG